MHLILMPNVKSMTNVCVAAYAKRATRLRFLRKLTVKTLDPMCYLAQQLDFFNCQRKNWSHNSKSPIRQKSNQRVPNHAANSAIIFAVKIAIKANSRWNKKGKKDDEKLEG